MILTLNADGNTWNRNKTQLCPIISWINCRLYEIMYDGGAEIWISKQKLMWSQAAIMTKWFARAWVILTEAALSLVRRCRPAVKGSPGLNLGNELRWGSLPPRDNSDHNGAWEEQQQPPCTWRLSRPFSLGKSWEFAHFSLGRQVNALHIMPEGKSSFHLSAFLIIFTEPKEAVC